MTPKVKIIPPLAFSEQAQGMSNGEKTHESAAERASNVVV